MTAVDANDIHHRLGELGARLTQQDRDRAELRQEIRDQNDKLDRIVGYIERQKGAKSTLLAVGSALAAVFGTLAGVAVQLFTSKNG